jgi:hypothetical protein
MDDQYVEAFLTNGEALVMLGKGTNDLTKIDKGIRKLEKAI